MNGIRNTNIRNLLILWLFPMITSAHAGPVDRYIDLMYDQTTTAYVITLIVGIISAINKLGLSINQSILTIGRAMYSFSWIMIGLGLFNEWPFFLSLWLAPVYIFPIVKRINVYKKTNPSNRLYRFVLNIVFTLMGTIMFWGVYELFVKTSVFLCANIIPDILFYRNIRDVIYNVTAFDVHFISVLFVIHGIWMFIKYLKRNNQEKNI